MTQELLKELFEYKNGNLYWKVSSGNVKVGKIAGTNHSEGYRKISINKKKYLEHRLVWLFHNGFFPTIHLDHINGVKDDNRIDNLRLATCSQNQANTQKKIGFSSRFKGVNWHKKAKKWVAQINVNGKKKYLGCFHEEDTAAQRYNEAAVKQFGEFALINKTNNNGTTN